MMRSILARRIGLTALAVASALAIMAPAASAEPVASDLLCQFTGVTGTLNPPIPAVAVEQDGLYSFHGGATCVAVDDTATPIAVKIESNGYYSNLVVGTGDVAGVACVTTAPNPDPTGEIGTTPCTTASETAPVDYFHFPGGGTGNVRVGYGIDFANSAGALGGGAYGPGTETGQAAGSLDAYNVVGAVQILANQAPPVSTFTVTGAFVGETP
jgi:hypothetical protein